MSELMVKMAKRASEDKALMASLISHYAEIEGLHWEDVAAHLWIDSPKLAKLALCRRPSQANFQKEIRQISNYVGIEDKRLVEFIRAAEGAQLAKIAKQQNETRRRPIWQTRWQTRGFALAFAFAALFIILLGSFLLLSPDQNGATLTVSTGQIYVARTGKLFYLIPRQTNRIIREGDDFEAKPGDTISGGEGAPARLLLADGSTVTFLESTKLIINRLFITDETYQVSLRLQSGAIENHVLRSLKAGDRYEVVTPSATASVRGTVFTVRVLSPEWSYIACTEGVVEVKTGDHVVQLQPGEEVYVKVSQLPTVQPLGSEPPQDTPVAPSGEQPAPAPSVVPPAPETPLPGTPAQETPAPAGADSGDNGITAPGETEAPSIDGPVTEPENPPDDGGKVVPGNPPGDEGKPQPGGEPPGQTKKDEPKGKK